MMTTTSTYREVICLRSDDRTEICTKLSAISTLSGLTAWPWFVSVLSIFIAKAGNLLPSKLICLERQLDMERFAGDLDRYWTTVTPLLINHSRSEIIFKRLITPLPEDRSINLLAAGFLSPSVSKFSVLAVS